MNNSHREMLAAIPFPAKPLMYMRENGDTFLMIPQPSEQEVWCVRSLETLMVALADPDPDTRAYALELVEDLKAMTAGLMSRAVRTNAAR